MALRLERLSRHYGAVTALDNVTLELPAGQTLGLIGPSGSGKSTLLRLVAGLETPSSGTVRLAARDLADVPARQRNFGVVFQDYALFPHLDVHANVAFGLVERHWSRERISARVREMLQLVGLSGLDRRRVQQLSGGQQQRVALARALAPGPGLLLLDEPLSNLDANLREELTRELAHLLTDPGLSAVHVTHDQAEAFRLADRIGILRDGTLVQHGPAREVLQQPVNAWVARFLGYRNVFDGTPARLLDEGLVSVTAAGGADVAASVLESVSHGSRLELKLKPDGWEHPLHWSGHARELDSVPVAGDRLGLLLPDAAWRTLEPA